MPRCFIALPFSPEVIQQLSDFERRLAGLLPALRWTPPQNLHLTLRFLGEQPEDSLEKLGEIVLSVGRSSAPFELTLAGLGAFPSWSRAQVVWLGLTASEPLGKLYRELASALLHLGLPPEQRLFRPHVTLGRCRHRAQRLPAVDQELQNGTVASFVADRISLFRSQLTKAGAVHTAMLTAGLGTDDIFCHPARV